MAREAVCIGLGQGQKMHRLKTLYFLLSVAVNLKLL